MPICRAVYCAVDRISYNDGTFNDERGICRDIVIVFESSFADVDCLCAVAVGGDRDIACNGRRIVSKFNVAVCEVEFDSFGLSMIGQLVGVRGISGET